MDNVLFSSNSDEWETPNDVFKQLDAEFGFTLDPCSDGKNSKCRKFFTKAEDGLKQSWGGGDSFLQSALLKNKRVGDQSVQGKLETEHRCSHADTGTHRYQMVS